MKHKFFSLAIVLLMVSSALAVLASSGWTPQGNPEREQVYKAHILTGNLTFLSTPNLTAEPDHLYQYRVVPNNYSATLNLTFLTPQWNQLLIVNWTLMGVPNATSVGLTVLSLKLTLGANITYQNFTIQVLPTDQYTQFGTLAIGLIFSFAFLFLGIRNPIFMMIAGIIWTLVSISIFSSYDPKPLFMMVGVGVGIIALFDGGFRQWS